MRQFSPCVPVAGSSKKFWGGKVRPTFNVVSPLPPLTTPSASSLDGALHNCFAEAVVSRGVTEESQFPPFQSCKEWFLGAYVEFDCGSYIVICFSVQVRDAQQFPPTFELKGLNAFFGICQKGP